jgi:hypothetical protein
MEHRCTQLEELDKDGEYQVETTRAGGWGLYATVSRRLLRPGAAMLTDNANVWPSGAPFDWNANPRRVRCRGCGREFEQRSRNNVYCTKECRRKGARA